MTSYGSGCMPTCSDCWIIELALNLHQPYFLLILEDDANGSQLDSVLEKLHSLHSSVKKGKKFVLSIKCINCVEVKNIKLCEKHIIEHLNIH